MKEVLELIVKNIISDENGLVDISWKWAERH